MNTTIAIRSANPPWRNVRERNGTSTQRRATRQCTRNLLDGTPLNVNWTATSPLFIGEFGIQIDLNFLANYSSLRRRQIQYKSTVRCRRQSGVLSMALNGWENVLYVIFWIFSRFRNKITLHIHICARSDRIFA